MLSGQHVQAFRKIRQSNSFLRLLDPEYKTTSILNIRSFVCFWRDSPLVGQGILIHEVSRSHSHTPHSVGLLWRSDQPVAETSTWQHSQQKNIQHTGGIRTHNLSKWEAAELRLRPQGHWNWRLQLTYDEKKKLSSTRGAVKKKASLQITKFEWHKRLIHVNRTTWH